MVLSRLLQVKSRLHLQRIGLVKATRQCSSSSSCSNAEIGNSKKPSLSKEQRAVAVESFVKKYMETHPGIFPKPTHVQNNVGGSWYTLKDILTKIKERLLENSQLQNRTTSDTSDSTVDATAFEIITTHNSKGNSELGKPTSTVINSECNNNISSTATSCMLGENFSKKIINSTAFEIVQTCGIADHTELCESESIVQSLKSSANSENNEKNTTHVTSNISEECSSPDAVNQEAFKVIKMHNYADSLKHAEPACKVRLSEAEVISRSNEKDISTSKEKNNSEFGEPIVPSSKTSLNTNDNEKNTTPSISLDGAQKISGLADLFMRRMNDRAAGEMTGEKDDSVTINSPEYSNEATRRDMVKSFDIKSLIDCLKEHRKEQSVIKSHDNMGMESNNFKGSGGDPGTRVPFNVSSTNSKSGDKEESDADIAAFDYIESKPSPQTKEGMQNVIVEGASSTENLPNKTSIPNLIGDPDVPSSLVKNPTRTVMIKQLTPDIRSHDIEEALAFCGSNISGFFFGSSSFVAYVEFETEDAKERALEKHSINVRGKQLLIFRIDAPRTTVVRISNLYSAEAKKKLFSICRSYGKVKVVVFRHKEIRDVHFMLSEWPNMLKILNRLNGLKIDDCRIIAQPALVFPPEVLRVLWSHRDERQRLETTIWMKTLLYTRLQKVHYWILYAMPMIFFLTDIKIPKIEGNDKYVDSGPPYLIFLHLALGPPWQVTRQKFHGGSISKGSDLQIEVAEFSWRNVQLHGSLIVVAENILGSTRMDENGELKLRYWHRCGRCKLQNIKVLNEGIDWTSKNNTYWKHDVQRFEALKVILHGNVEFEATDVVFQNKVQELHRPSTE